MPTESVMLEPKNVKTKEFVNVYRERDFHRVECVCKFVFLFLYLIQCKEILYFLFLTSYFTLVHI